MFCVEIKHSDGPTARHLYPQHFHRYTFTGWNDAGGTNHDPSRLISQRLQSRGAAKRMIRALKQNGIAYARCWPADHVSQS